MPSPNTSRRVVWPKGEGWRIHRPNSLVRHTDTCATLKLVLHTTSYDWESALSHSLTPTCSKR